jgi:hypothetical protein
VDDCGGASPLCEIWPVTGRPLLKTLWPVLRRGAGSVQSGTDPDHAVVLEGLQEDEVRALQSLDGTRAAPPALRCPAGQDLLDLLIGHGLVVDAGSPASLPQPIRALLAHDAQALLRTATPPPQAYAALVRRHGAHLFVVGRGELPTSVAALLRHAGVGTVRQGIEVADDWEQSVDDPELGRTRSAGPTAPSLVVMVGSQAVDAAGAGPWRARGIPVLPVVLHALEAVVGPVVVPDGPCLRCLDLTRADLDPSWPALLGQLLPAKVGAGPDISGETTLVGLAASMTAMVALAVLDGQVLPVGRSLEVSLPWPRVRQRQWDVHPRCGCTAGSALSGRPADAQASTQARMAG